MNLAKFDLTGKTAIVTGGGRGIGKSICLTLAKAGANIVVANRDVVTGEATAREVRDIGKKSLAIPTDVCIRDQVEQLMNKTVATFGAIDILVNNAGGHTLEAMVPVLEMSEGIWDSVVNLNLKSVFLCSQAAAKIMVKQKKGTIINISSWYSFMPIPVCIPYGASKAGVNNLTQTLAHELGQYNIRVNAIAPGVILPIGGGAEVVGNEILEGRRKMSPLGRLGTPEDVGWAVVFLASDAASYIDGQVLTIDGALPRLP